MKPETPDYYLSPAEHHRRITTEPLGLLLIATVLAFGSVVTLVVAINTLMPGGAS